MPQGTQDGNASNKKLQANIAKDYDDTTKENGEVNDDVFKSQPKIKFHFNEGQPDGGSKLIPEDQFRADDTTEDCGRC